MTGQPTAATVLAASKPLVDWASLGEVVLLALSAAVLIVGGYSLGLAALDVYVSSRRRPAGDGGGTAVAAGRVRHDALAVALVSFAICVAGVAAGLWAMLVR